MEKTYNHLEHEEKIYRLWEASGAFTPKVDKKKKPFTIIMPPPNASDPLHIGHARFVAIEDILTRYHRMMGEPTLWLPGADHAGIETQYVFEKRLKQGGKSRFDYDRETLYKMIWNYVSQNKGVMENQLRILGASCDWTRNKFTLNPAVIKIVYKTFKKLFDENLIYRGERIVNYCPRCGTAYSQLEIDTVEREDNLYHLSYGPVVIATTRPETIFADVAVAVNPKDERYKKLVGKKACLPLVNRELPIITDPLVDINFGTGALKITPGHDALDFEIGRKHGLSTISIIDGSGQMINTPEKYIGLKINEAREEVFNDLVAAKKIVKVEKIKHLMAICYRDRGLIEPLVSKQWFIKVAPLAKTAFIAINQGEVKFAVKKFEKIAKHWLKNLKDWNISRQIVWGIRIPAWRCEKCLEWIITEGTEPAECTKCGYNKLKQDTDTFDTWFSSGQWPFATLLSESGTFNGSTGSPSRAKSRGFQLPITNKERKKFGDFDYFYPTSVMETAYDILPFWVIRMIMLGLYATGEVPFRKVLIHGLVRDKEGQKISKSKGNVIDPVEMSKKYGADALRMAIIWGALIENDISLSEDNVKGQRNFANKIWNVARFVFLEPKGKDGKRNEDDKVILNQLRATTKKVSRLLDKYRISEAAQVLYEFIWHTFADIYIEKVKVRRPEAQKTLEYVLQESLKLLHPFVPFVSEVIWQKGKERFDSPLLITAPWPKP